MSENNGNSSERVESSYPATLSPGKRPRSPSPPPSPATPTISTGTLWASCTKLISTTTIVDSKSFTDMEIDDIDTHDMENEEMKRQETVPESESERRIHREDSQSKCDSGSKRGNNENEGNSDGDSPSDSETGNNENEAQSVESENESSYNETHIIETEDESEDESDTSEKNENESSSNETNSTKTENESENESENDTETQPKRPPTREQVLSLYKMARRDNSPNIKICCPDGAVFYWEREDILNLIQQKGFWVSTAQMDTFLHLCLRKCEKWLARCHIWNSDIIGQRIGLSPSMEIAAAVLKQQLHQMLTDVQFNLIPFYLNHHWHLIIICGLSEQTSTQPQIWHLNSLRICRINEHMKNAMKEVVEDKTGKPTHWYELQVPQQGNLFDCGFFVMKFVFQFKSNLVSPQPQGFVQLMARQVDNEQYGANLRSTFQKLMLFHLFEHETDPPVQVLPIDFDEYIIAHSTVPDPPSYPSSEDQDGCDSKNN